MATILRLADENANNTVDLYGGVFKLEDGSWSTPSAPMEQTYQHVPFGAQPTFEQYGVVVEQLRLAAGTNTVPNLIAAQRDIFEALEAARRFHDDPHEYMSWWLEANADGESARRTLLYGGAMRMIAQPGIEPLLTYDKARMHLSISRHPFWENKVISSASSSVVECLGGTLQIIGATGDVPARISNLKIGGNTGKGPLTEFWIGIRPKYWSMTNFEPLWECEDGSNGTDSTDTVDATASGGDMVRCDFSTETGIDNRWSMTVNQVCAANSHTDYNHFLGSYTVLLRCKVTAGTVGARLGYGFSSTPDDELVVSEEQYLTHTSYKLVEMGEINIPPYAQYRWMGVSEDSKECKVALLAEQISGSGSLDMDCLVLIPSRHSVHAKGCAVVDVLGDSRPLYILTGEDDKITSNGYYSGDPVYNIALAVNPQWYLPVSQSSGDSILVLAGQRASSHVVGDDVDVTVQYYPRWSMYRG